MQGAAPGLRWNKRVWARVLDMPQQHENAMDVIAINELRARYTQAVRSAETYRDAAETIAALREFYHALAITYERSAREMRLMLDAVERIDRDRDIAA
jgi:hypothetical protein